MVIYRAYKKQLVYDLGLLDDDVEVQARGGKLDICWFGAGKSILMTGQATTVFCGEIDLPDNL